MCLCVIWMNYPCWLGICVFFHVNILARVLFLHSGWEDPVILKNYQWRGGSGTCCSGNLEEAQELSGLLLLTSLEGSQPFDGPHLCCLDVKRWKSVEEFSACLGFHGLAECSFVSNGPSLFA